MKIKTGIGVDAHQFTSERKLILGGVEIDYEFGLAGHSDADVLIHAIIDCIAGAGLSTDIGRIFPDTDSNYKNIDSRILLREVQSRIKQKKITISNVDAVIIAQQPKLSPHIDNMIKNISDDLQLPLDDISIKATTTEHMGFTGRKEGIVAMAICTLIQD